MTEVRKGEDVVSEDVLSSIVELQHFTVGIETDVLLNEHIAAAFVGVDGPTAVVVHADIVDQVLAEDRAGLLTQRVDPPHVVQQP